MGARYIVDHAVLDLHLERYGHLARSMATTSSKATRSDSKRLGLRPPSQFLFALSLAELHPGNLALCGKAIDSLGSILLADLAKSRRGGNPEASLPTQLAPVNNFPAGFCKAADYYSSAV